MQKNEQLLILNHVVINSRLSYISLKQVHGVKLISISKCRLQPVEQVANESAGSDLPLLTRMMLYSGAIHNIWCVILHGFNGGI